MRDPESSNSVFRYWREKPLIFVLASLLALWTVIASREAITNAARLWGVSMSVFEAKHLGPTDPPLQIEKLEGDSNAYFKIRLDFRVHSSTGYPNLFQTDGVNSGIRAEISGDVIAVIVADSGTLQKFRVLVLSSDLQPGKWDALEISGLHNTFVEARLEGAEPVKAVSDDIAFDAKDVRIGVGFGPERRFTGEIRNVLVLHGAARPAAFGLQIYAAFCALALLLFTSLLVASWDRISEDAMQLWAHARRRRGFGALRSSARIFPATANYGGVLLCGGFLCLFLAATHLVLYGYFEKLSLAALPTLLPGFEPQEGARLFKSEIIGFVLIELSYVGVVATLWFSRIMQYKIELFSPSSSFSSLSVAFSLGSLLAIFAVPHLIVKGLFAIAFALFTAAAVTHRVPVRRALVRACFVLDLLVWITGNQAARAISALRLHIHAVGPNINAGAEQAKQKNEIAGSGGQSRSILALFLIASVAIVALWPAVQAWYPVVIPNDYYELDDTFRIKSSQGDVYLNRRDLLRCLENQSTSAELSPNAALKPEAVATLDWRCPASSAALKEASVSAIRSLIATSGAQGETGRILYHHSYIFVPARHLLAYGLDAKIPYLYGYGNTFFHAALMSFAEGATLTTYFNTLPLAELIGLMAIVAVVGYGARSIFAALTAFALGLTAFYTIDFYATLLAASFSPLRYVGLIAQLASIFFVFRGPPRQRSFAIPLAMAASFFWNREFAILGCFGQGLALLSPSLALPRLHRFGLLALSIIVAAVCILVGNVSPDITNTIELGFLNIGVPVMTVEAGAIFFLLAFGWQAAFALTAFRFRGDERDARLCILPVLALVVIKYVYNPAPPHLSFIGVLLLPMALVFFPWAESLQTSAKRGGLARIVQASAAALALGASLWAGHSYLQSSQDFHRSMVGDFVAKSWTTLVETIPMVTPEAPIAQRVLAIRKEMKPQDKLLILSPFDHVLSFYVNPRAFCGHFDLLTNIGTRTNVQSVLTCARNSPDVLIVYDAALETPCPNLADGVLHIETKCPHKLVIKRNIQALMANLKPSVATVSSIGELTFYRLRARAAESPPHSVREQKPNI